MKTKILLILLFVSPAFAADFPFELFRSLNGDNIAVSPHSVASALALVKAGAASETESEINAVIGQTGTPEADSLFSGGVYRRSDSPFQMALGLWTQRGAEFLPSFKETAEKTFGAESAQTDFAANPLSATQKINDWVNTKTNGKIPTLFGKYDKLGESTRAVIVAAAHFEAAWKTPFLKTNTFGGNFTTGDGKKIKTDFMSQTGSFKHYEGKDVTVLELPYKNEGFLNNSNNSNMSMLILLPKTNDGLAKLTAELSSEKLNGFCESLKPAQIEVQLPRFTVSFETELSEPLQKLGMRLAFGKSADFSRMNGMHDLYLSQVAHKVFVKVDEAGTEAAAASGAVIGLKSIAINAKQFIANYPFVYVIRKTDDAKKDGTILFIGALAKPEANPEPRNVADPNLSGIGGAFE